MDSSRVLVDVPTHRFAASCAEEVSRNIRCTRVPDTGAYDIARCIEDYHTTCARVCNGNYLEGAEDRVEEGMHREAELMFNKLVGEQPYSNNVHRLEYRATRGLPLGSGLVGDRCEQAVSGSIPQGI